MLGIKKKSYINQICSGICMLKPDKAQWLVQFRFKEGNAFCHSLKDEKDVNRFLDWAKKTIQDFELCYISKADGKNIAELVKIA